MRQAKLAAVWPYVRGIVHHPFYSNLSGWEVVWLEQTHPLYKKHRG